VIGAFDNRYDDFWLSPIGRANASADRVHSPPVGTHRIASAATHVAMVELDALTGFKTGSIPDGPAESPLYRIDAIDLDADGSAE